jgi:hypothetical protein
MAGLLRGALRSSGRREATYLGLAAAEVCWVLPVFLCVGQGGGQHRWLLTWLGMLILLLAFFYAYRSIEAAGLTQGLQKGLLAAILLLAIGLVLHFYIYRQPGLGWVVALFRNLADVEAVDPRGWMTVMFLVYLWARGIRLGRRSLTVDSVGFTFRAGIVILVLESLLLGLIFRVDLSGLVLPYFFFSLVAVALARVDEVSRSPNSSQVGTSSFWVGSSVAGVAVLVLAGAMVAAFFSGAGLQQVLAWLSPLFDLFWLAIAAAGTFLLLLLEALLSLLSIDLELLGQGIMDALRRIGEFLMAPAAVPPAPSSSTERPGILGFLQLALAVGIPLLIVGLVLLAAWARRRRLEREAGNESRESISAGAAGRGLQAMLRAGLERLGELVGLVDRFGLGSRFLAAVSIRRVYANLVRLATQEGYPRARCETPYEYLATLRRALPGSEAEVQTITEAYVSAHYGQVPDTREELERIRACWQRVRAGRSSASRGP